MLLRVPQGLSFIHAHKLVHLDIKPGTGRGVAHLQHGS